VFLVFFTFLHERFGLGLDKNFVLIRCCQVKNCGMVTYGEHQAWAYSRVLRAEPCCEFQGQSPWSKVRDKAPWSWI